MRKLGASLRAGMFLIASLACASVADAQVVPGKEHAKKLFDEGIELEKKADYAAALTKYKEAEQITATAGLRFHEGYCLEMTGKLTAALEVYDAADKMAREQNKQDVHAAVVARLDPLRARVPQLAIRLATPAKDAEVQLDGVTVAAPLLDGTAFRVDPGDHVVTAHAGGFKAFTRKVPVPEKITTTVDVTFERAVTAPVLAPAPEPSAPITEPPNEPPASRSRVLPIATTAGAIALAAGGIAFFLVADSKQSDAQRDCPTKTSCDTERTSVRTFDTLALAGFAGAAALGVLSVVLWTSKTPARPDAHARISASPRAVGIEGVFW